MADAELYASASGCQRRFVSEVLDRLWPRLDWSRNDPYPSVLDVGCGSGAATVLELVPRLPPSTCIVVVDSSEETLHKAIATYPEGRVRFELGDIGSHRLRNDAFWFFLPFSKVFSFFCLHWVTCQRTAVKNISDVLVPGGEAVLVFIASCPLFDLFAEFAKNPRYAEYMRDYSFPVSPYRHREDPEEYFRALLAQTGFTVMSCQLDKDFAFSSTNHQEIIDSLHAVVPFAARMPPADRDSFLLELVAACYTNGTLSVQRGKGPWGADLHRWNFGLMVVHAVKGAQRGSR